MAISDKRENSDNGLVSKIGIKNKVYEIKDLIAREEVEKILTDLEEFDEKLTNKSQVQIITWEADD